MIRLFGIVISMIVCSVHSVSADGFGSQYHQYDGTPERDGRITSKGSSVNGLTLAIDRDSTIDPKVDGSGNDMVAYLINSSDKAQVVPRGSASVGYDEDIYTSSGDRLKAHDPRGVVNVSAGGGYFVPAHSYRIIPVRVAAKYDLTAGVYQMRLRVFLENGKTLQSGMGSVHVNQ